MNARTSNASWHPAKKVLFRFCFLYFVIYCFPFPLDAFEFTKPLAQPFYNFLDWLIPIVAKKFQLNAVPAFPMFDKLDDSNYGLAFCYLNLIISATVAIVWTLLNRKRGQYENLYQWLRLYLRFFLAAYLFGYGFVKVFPSQFQAITASRLASTVGDESPMLLAWNFMGYSNVMMRLNGIAEVLAGLLLLFRRTTTIGAILSAGVFSFVVTMDFCFNVPVRMLASHLLIISAFLTLDDSRRLLNIFFLNRPTATTVYAPLIAQPRGRKIFFAVQTVLAVCILYSGIASALEAQKEYGWNPNPTDVPLYGVYNTTYFIRNSDTIPAIETDSLRWKEMVIDGGNWQRSGIIEFVSGKKLFCDISADTTKKIINIQSKADTSEKYSLNYLENGNQILFKGKWEQDSIEALMTKYDLNNYLLHREKFSWIKQ
ncbi:MAG TPA: DoxX family protein [Parafilimonas sp.]|nr:DoxX family protein [Parafilimonas sp.]